MTFTFPVTRGTHVVRLDRFELKNRSFSDDMFVYLAGAVVWSTDPEKPPGSPIEYVWSMSSEASILSLRKLILLIAKVLNYNLIDNQYPGVRGDLADGELVDFSKYLIEENRWGGKIVLRVNVAGIPCRFPGIPAWSALSDEDLFTSAERLGSGDLAPDLAEYWMGVAHKTLKKLKGNES